MQAFRLQGAIVTQLRGIAWRLVAAAALLVAPSVHADGLRFETLAAEAGLAEKAGTIPYEIFCGISTRRVRRVYVG